MREDPDAIELVETPEYSDETRHEAITTLARRFSQLSGTSQAGINTFLDSTEDPELDPNDDKFDSRKWVKNLLTMTSRDPDRYPRRTAGVTFRNLTVFGYGTGADFQANFLNIWVTVLDWLRTKLGFMKPKPITILQDFDGIVRPGEMLVVLGRPGRYGHSD